MKHIIGLVAVLVILLPVQVLAQATTTQPAATDTQPVEAAAQPVEPAAQPVEPAAPVGIVTRALFTSGIVSREPVDTIEDTSTIKEKVYFFTEFNGMEGQTVIHRWKYLGVVKAELSFKVRAWRWRVYSSKVLISEWASDWTVDVIDSNGNVLVTKVLSNAG